MDAIYSGQAGVMALLEGAEARVRRADDFEDEVVIGREGVSYLFQGCNDVVVVKGAREDEVRVRLESAWEADRALRLFLIALDPEEETELRAEAANYLEELLEKMPTRLFVENEFYSRVLPKDIDIDFLLASERWRLSSGLIMKILEKQGSIGSRRQDWDSLPVSLFHDDDKSGFEEYAIRSGAFRILAAVNSESEHNLAILNCYQTLAKAPNSRAVINEWTVNLKRPSSKHVVVEEDPEEFPETTIDETVNSYEAYERSSSQRDAIKEKLKSGSLNLARKYAEQLVRSQLQGGGDAKYAAKSLCDIAQTAKYYHLHSLQLEWAQRAVDICPSDAWAHGQAADALIQFSRLDEALTEFNLSEAYGDPQFAATGRARLLRHQGRLDEALTAFRRAREVFKGHEGEPFAWSGAAEVLRDMWRFQDALKEYEQALVEFPDTIFLRCSRAAVLADLGQLDAAYAAYDMPDLRGDLVALNGKASVLKYQGRLHEALQVINRAIEYFPSDPIARCSQADILRIKGDLEDALQVYGWIKAHHPTIPVAYSGYAEVLRDMRKLPEAVAAYEDAVNRFPVDVKLANGYANIRKVSDELSESLRLYEKNVKQFPYDFWSKAGRADLLKRLGKYNDAIAAYDEILRIWPDYDVARNGKAAILVIKGNFAEALSLLPAENPVTIDDWVAWHIRGMVLLRRNEIDEAISFFEDGRKMVPFARERKYFSGALSIARLRKGQFEQATKVLSDTGGSLSNILRFHSLAGAGNVERARLVFNELIERCPTRLIDLRDAIASKFGFGVGRSGLPNNDNWIFGRESEALLQEAA